MRRSGWRRRLVWRFHAAQADAFLAQKDLSAAQASIAAAQTEIEQLAGALTGRMRRTW
ncbi:MAG: hypothetical protein H6644_00205 [Caldilineaceae bacterium]|nr:hypothetical protein [Caldilineaceae bacterium]